MLRFCQPMFDAMRIAVLVKHMAYILPFRAIAVAWRLTELAAVICQNGIDFMGKGLGEVTQKDR